MNNKASKEVLYPLGGFILAISDDRI